MVMRMQCPNCQMNIKDGSKFCIHCGTQFNASMGMQTSQIQSGTPICPKCQAPIPEGAQFCTNCGAQLNGGQSNQQVLVNTQNTQIGPSTQPIQPVVQQSGSSLDSLDKEKYFNAYFNDRYHEVAKSSFSIGTFFLEWWWLIAYKLYNSAGMMFLFDFGITIGIRVLLYLFFILFGLAGVPLVGLVGLIAFIWNRVRFAKDFSSDRIAKASKEIDSILRSTDDEFERIERCKNAGKPLYFVFALFVLPMIIGIIGAFSGLGTGISSTSSTIENSKKDMFADTSRMYLNAVKNAVAADEIKCGDVMSKLGAGVYYYTFTTAKGDGATKLLDQGGKSSWDSANVSGQAYIYKYINSDTGITSYKYAIVLVDEKGRGFGEFNGNGVPEKVIGEQNINRSTVSNRDGNNRKKFYNQARQGYNNYPAPTSMTEWDSVMIKNFDDGKGNHLDKEPIACEVTGY